MSLINSKHFVIYNSLTDTEMEIFNLADFCRVNNLSETSMRDVIKGRQKQHKGFYGKEIGSDVSLKQTYTMHTRSNQKQTRQKKTKQERYNQSQSWIDFITNCSNYHYLLHIEQKLSCNKIGKLIGVAGELVRLQFKKNNLEVIRYPDGPERGALHPRYKLLTTTQQSFLDNFPSQFNTLHNEQKLSVWEIADKHGLSETTIHNYRRRYNLPYTNNNKSKPHILLTNILDQMGVEYHDNYRRVISPKEIDIYMPHFNLGIEINGVYWHSESKVGRRYHLDKHIACTNNNIRLIQFFDDEILDRTQICVSILRGAVGLIEDRVYARNTYVRKIPYSEASKFINQNHIQGTRTSSICYGLFDKHNDLVQCMTFSKDKKYQYQLMRLCTKTNTICVGGANKLLSTFVKEYIPNSIVSYCDIRLFDGLVYEKLGFQLSHTSSPNYYYFHKNNTIRKSRVQFQKHKQPTVLSAYDSNLTEWENMQNNDYDRIWDCGNKVYVWHPKP